MWPEIVTANEIQSRLLNDGLPVERALTISSEVNGLRIGDRYRIERPQGDLYLYALTTPGYFAVASE